MHLPAAELPTKNEVQGQLNDHAQQIDQSADGGRRTQKHKDANANAISGIAKKNSHGNSEQQTKQVHKRKTQERNQALDRRHSPTGTTPAPAEGAEGDNGKEEQNRKHNAGKNDVAVLQSSSTTQENAEESRKYSQGTRGPARQPTGESQNAERVAGVAEVLKFTSDGFPTNSRKTTERIQRQENTEDSGSARLVSTPTKLASRSSICCGDHEGPNTLFGIECRLRPELP